MVAKSRGIEYGNIEDAIVRLGINSLNYTTSRKSKERPVSESLTEIERLGDFQRSGDVGSRGWSSSERQRRAGRSNKL